MSVLLLVDVHALRNSSSSGGEEEKKATSTSLLPRLELALSRLLLVASEKNALKLGQLPAPSALCFLDSFLGTRCPVNEQFDSLTFEPFSSLPQIDLNSSSLPKAKTGQDIGRLVQLVTHQAFSAMAKHEGEDTVLFVGHSPFPARLYQAATALCKSTTAFPGKTLQFALLDLAPSSPPQTTTRSPAFLHLTLEQILHLSPTECKPSPVITSIPEKRMELKGEEEEEEEQVVVELNSVEDILREVNALSFQDFAKHALALGSEQERARLAEALDAQHAHLAVALLAREAANAQRVRVALLKLSFAWKDSIRFANYLRTDFRALGCCEEIWQTVREQFLDEEEHDGARPLLQRSSSSSVLERVQSLKPDTGKLERASSLKTLDRVSSPNISGAATAAAVTSRLPLVQLKRNGRRNALNHFVGEYLSNPQVHFRQVRTASNKPLARAASAPSSSKRQQVSSSSPIVVPPLASLPASSPVLLFARGSEQSAAVLQRRSSVLETPVAVPPTPLKPNVATTTSTVGKTRPSAKRLFEEDEDGM